ncbi:hypothetical protein E5288_WYG000333 [Bos mutus]|uniref:Uncharacterized protein n=1 Tax=Bos mutus TaxID=72004 RepID=A0A6B0QUY1_9CETA|nr:hypothetical protein [Bos mutus]
MFKETMLLVLGSGRVRPGLGLALGGNPTLELVQNLHPAESPWDRVGAGKWGAGSRYRSTVPARGPEADCMGRNFPYQS